jgi:predicted permease
VWRNLAHRDRVERDLHDEIRSTFDMLVGEKMRHGLSAEEARRSATIELGRIESIKSEVRDARAGAWLESVALDLRYAARLLRRSPVFTAFAVGSLTLGIGATAAIFSLFDGIVLRKLGVPEADRLVVASFGRAGGNYNYSLPYPHFEQLRARSTTLAGIFAINPFGRVNVAWRGEPDIAEGIYVTGDYYGVLRLAPAEGRLLGPGDDRPGQAVAVLSHAYWQRRFAGRTDVIGAAVTLNQIPFTVVGVEPAGFSGTEVGRPYDISIPMRARDAMAEGKPIWNEHFATWIYMMARLKPGVTIEAAEQEARTIFAQVSLDGARTATQLDMARVNHLRLEPGATGSVSSLRRNYERWLRMLLMMLGAVLLLASLNVATLLLSRSDARRREMAIRLALGAGRWRIVRQLLTESLLLATCAGALGLALASWGSRTLLRTATPAAERLPIELTPDPRLILFTAAVAGLTCLLFGVVPALRSTSPGRFVGTRQAHGARDRRLLDRGLVASQVALSLVLLVAAGLFVRTLAQLWAQDPGYDRQNVLMFSVDAKLAGKRGDEVRRVYARVLEELRTIPGAAAVTVSAVRPVSDGYYFISSYREIGDKTLSNEARVRVAYNSVGPGYFAALGIPLLAGRDFDDRDTPESPKVAIVSQRMARHFTGNPVGQQLGAGEAAREVVGVVRDIRYGNVKDAPREVVYFPIFQATGESMWYSPTFEIRFAGAAGEILQSAREAVARADAGLTVFRVNTLQRQTEESFARERLLAYLATYFGAFAVLLACIGLYGLLSYGVTQRTAEMGLRMALGAEPSAVRWLVVRESAWTVLVGVIAGLLASLAAARTLQSQLFGVLPHDRVALAAATVLLLATTFAAAYLPARRASRVDPLTALRHE